MLSLPQNRSSNPCRLKGRTPNALLANGFKQYNRNGSGQIQRTRPVHRNRETRLAVLRQQAFRQSFCLSSENEEIAIAKIDVVVRAPGLRCQEKIAGSISLCALQFPKGIPDLHVNFVPIIETGAFQFSIIKRKAKRFDQMQSGSRRKTKPTNVARVRRNFRLDQNNVKHRSLRNPGKQEKTNQKIIFLRSCFL